MNQLDPEGYIQPEADLANLQPEYQGLPDATADLLADEFGPRLHSAYLYGSVIRGNAVPGRSDLDVILSDRRGLWAWARNRDQRCWVTSLAGTRRPSCGRSSRSTRTTCTTR